MKTKKLLMLIVIMSMFIGIMPWTSVQAESTFSGTLDFEDIAEGTSADEIGGITLSGNGTAKITKDDFGTKAIKMTTPMQLKFNFPSTTDKTVTVSYRFRSENHIQNANLYEFGSVLFGESRAIKSVINNSTVLTYFNGTAMAYNKGITNVTPSETYHTVKYVINTVDKQFNVFVDDVAVTPWIGKWLFWDNTLSSVNTLLFNQPYSGGNYWIDDVKVEEGMKASWTIPSNNSTDVSALTKTLYAKFDSTVNTSLIGVYDGETKIGAAIAQDSVENLVKISLTDSLESGKTYTVSSDGSAIFKFTTATAPKSILYSQDFNSVSNLGNLKGWAFMAGSGSTIDVANDTTTGNKALKMTIGKAATANYAKVYFPQSTTSRVKVSYTLRFENHSRWSLENEGFGTIMNGSNLVNKNMLYGNGYKAYGSYNNTGSNSNLLVISETDKEQKKIETYLDFTTNKEKVYVNGVLTANDFVLQGTETNADSIMFRVRYNSSGCGTSTDGTEDNNGVYWIDDIKVENLDTFYIDSITPSDNAQDIAIGTNVCVSFNEIADAATVNENTISLNDIDNNKIDCTYSVDGNKVIITPKALLHPGSQYTVSINGVKSTNGIAAQTFTSTFKTVMPNATNYKETFDNYTSGATSAEINGLTSSVVSNAVVLDDGTGNKALKATSNTNLTFSCDPTTRDSVEVSYKMKVASFATSTALYDFGSVMLNSSKAIYAINYNGGINAFFGSNGSNNKNVRKFAVDTDYHTVKYIINIPQKQFDLYYDGVKQSSYLGSYWGFYDTTVNSVNKLFIQVCNSSVIWFDDITIKDASLEIASSTPSDKQTNVLAQDSRTLINFNLEVAEKFATSDYFALYESDKKLDSTEYTVTMNDSKSVYVTKNNWYLGNTNYKIIVSKDINKGEVGYYTPNDENVISFTTGPMRTSDTPVKYDFEKDELGCAPSGDWNLSIPDNNSSISVENDPTDEDNYNQALKIVIGSSTSNTGAELKFAPTVSEKVHISYDLRAENSTRSFLNGDLGSVGYKTQKVVKAISSNSYARFFFQNGSAYNTMAYNLSDTKAYKHIEYEIDRKSKKYQIFVDGVRKSFYAGYDFNFYDDCISLDSLSFLGNYNSVDPKGAVAGDAGVYFIDNVQVNTAGLRIISSFPVNNTTGVPTNRGIDVEFNSTLDESTLTYDNIEVYAGATLLTPDKYSIKKIANNKISIIPSADLLYDSQYKVIMKNINDESDYLTSSDDIVLKFTTSSETIEDDPFKTHISDIDNAILPITESYYNFTISGATDGDTLTSQAVSTSDAIYTGKTWTNSDNVTFEFMRIKTEPFYYDGSYHDDTYAAAYMAYPKGANASSDKLPAILLLHGAGQTAQSAGFYNNATKWAKAGYVVMAVDLPGIAVPPTQNTVSSGTILSIPSNERDKYRFVTKPDIKANSTYVSEATALKAFNLLYNSRITDKSKVGITGISMGGYTTTLLSGLLGDKVKAAFSCYGCGFYEYGTTFATYLDPESTYSPNYGNPNEIYKWLVCYDAGRRANNVTANFFFGSAANDIFYYPSSVMKTYESMTNAASKNIFFSPNESHQSSFVGGTTDSTRRSIWKAEDHFFDYWLKGEGEKPTTVEYTSELYTKSGDSDNKYIDVFVTHGTNTTFSEPVIYYSQKTNIAWKDREWIALTAMPEINFERANQVSYTCAIPNSLLNSNIDFYATVSDSNVMSESTLIYQPNLSEDTYIYVDALNGNDDNSGSKDSPYRTISKAKEAVREMVNTANKDVYVVISGGVYNVAETLSFNSSDVLKNGCVVHYIAKDGETPVISGGMNVEGWELYDSAKNIYKANVDISDTRQLYINGRRAVRARSNDSMGITAYSDTQCVTDNTEIASWKNLSDVEIVFAKLWTNPRISVSFANTDNNKTYLTMNEIGWNAVNHDSSMTCLYSDKVNEEAWYVENAYELLDEKGEWYFDKTTKTLYYKPLDFEDMSRAEAVVPMVENLMTISGTDTANICKNISFEGLTFAYTTWLKPSVDGFNIGAQDNIDNSVNLNRHGQIEPAAITTRFAKNISFDGCTFKDMGSNAVYFDKGTKFTSLVNSKIYDVSGGALYIGPVRAITENYNPSDKGLILDNILIKGNLIHNIGVDYMAAAAISAGYPTNSSFIDNEIYSIPYSAFHIGYGWSTMANTDVVTSGIEIKNNYIHDVLNTRIYDGGAIYTLGKTGGTPENPNRIENNYLKNVWNYYGALYNDEGSTGWLLKNNVFDNTEVLNATGKNVRWLHWHTSSIKGCVAEENYTTTEEMLDNAPDSEVSNTYVFNDAQWSVTAMQIIDNAGIKNTNNLNCIISGKPNQNGFDMNVKGGYTGNDIKESAAIVAVYQNGRLIKMNYENIKFDNSVSIDKTFGVSDLTAGSYTAKVYLWSPCELKPMSESYEYSFSIQ